MKINTQERQLEPRYQQFLYFYIYLLSTVQKTKKKRPEMGRLKTVKMTQQIEPE